MASLGYPLQNGYISNWLIAGPQAIFVEDLDRYTGPDYKLQIARHYYQEEHGIEDMPQELAPAKIGDFEGTWKYYRCKDDHFVDLSAFYHTTHYLRAWACAMVYSPADREFEWVLTTNGPADVWINTNHVHRQEHFHHQIPCSVPFKCQMHKGYNQIVVRFEEVAARECPYSMALQVIGISDEIKEAVRLPTTIERVARRRKFENIFEAAYTMQEVYKYADEVKVLWPDDLEDSASITVRMQTPSGRIYSETNRLGSAGNHAILGQAVQFPDGQYNALVMPRPKEFHEGMMRISRPIPLRTIRGRYSQEPYSTYQERRIEALKDAALRSRINIFSDIAKMAIGWWERVSVDRFLEQIESINKRSDCSDFYLVGLLGMIYRFGDDPNFPEALKQPLEDCILNFKYWNDEPGSDAMWYTSENHAILFHTCEVLAGQLYPDRVFSNNGQTGRWHQEMGEKRAVQWLQQRAGYGFTEWDSNCYFEEDILALTHLADLAENSEVWELASVVLDKMFFSMAVNSYKGTFGSTHGRTYTPLIKGGYFEATAGISRLAWGMGIYNNNIMGLVSLACSQYELPEIIAEIANHFPEEMWSREQVKDTEAGGYTSGPAGDGLNKVTYKTPDYMLASAQDYHPGEPGYQQHIWQATMSPDAVVFVTHPTCVSEEGSHRPNFWHGNAILPRTAQWKDVLVSVHNLPENDWMGFTHAYFPVYAFDETNITGGWAFGKRGDGYIAITASTGIELIKRGDNAFRELRSYGKKTVWLVQMGRSALDGTFADFQKKVLENKVNFGELTVEYETLRGDKLAFGWEGPLTLNGEEQPLSGFKHIDNMYCQVEFGAPVMEIQLNDQVMRLIFEKQDEEA